MSMSVADKDYYHILGLTKDADERAIKMAFRRQARRYHPDVNAGDAAAEQLFKDINEAYRTLIDPVLRRRYDAVHAASATMATSYKGAAAPSRGSGRPVSGPSAWRLFWHEEREALAYTVRWLRRRLSSLNTKVLLAALVCSVLLVTLAQQWLGPHSPWVPGSADTSQSHAGQRQHGLPAAGVAPARHTPVYLQGHCLRWCSASSPHEAPASPRPAPAASPQPAHRPLYLYGGCVRYCPPRQQQGKGPTTTTSDRGASLARR